MARERQSPSHGKSRRRIALAAALTTVSAFAVGLTAPAASAAAVTLPDMQILVPTNSISIAIDGSRTRVLRYAHITSDLGTGPFELDPTYNSATGTATFTQAIYSSPSPGVWTLDHSVPVNATGVFNPPSDYNFPLTSFALYHSDGTGALGALAATSPKTDYCITGDTQVGGVPNTPNVSSPPVGNCADPTKPLGWSVGWGDEYDETDPGQPIDLTGLADGVYVLRGIVDPKHVLTESDPTNNITDTVLTITGTSVTVGAQTHPNSTQPTVSLTNPASGSQVSGTVTLSATAAATAPATVASVQFLLDGQPLGPSITAPPYSFDWTVGSTPPGSHTLSALVTDSAGAMGTATGVPITVPTQGGGGSGPLAIDAQVSQTGASSVTSPAFSTTSAGDVILALVGTDGPSGQSTTVTGGGLTWTLAKRANGQPGDAEVWKAVAPSALSGVSVTSTAARSGYDQQLTVVALKGAAGVGATASSSTTTLPGATYAATAAGSIGFGVGNDYDKAVARTLGSGQALLSQFLDTRTGDSFWAQDTTTGAAAAGGSVTLNDTAPSGDHTNFAIVEVTPGAAAPPPPPPDTTPPTVSIVNPTNNQTVSGTIPLAANAMDNIAVASVQFLVDGKAFGAPVTASPYATTLDTTTLTNATHTIAATAVDTSGNPATSAPITVTVTNPAPPMACFVRQAQVTVHGKGTVTTAAFSTAVPDEVLLAFVSSDGPKTASSQSVTVSGGGLTWKRVGAANKSFGDSEVWTANVAAVTQGITVRSTPSKAGYDQDLTVVAMEGATGTGAVSAVSAASGAPATSVTTTGPASSLVFAVGNDWDRAVARTLPVGQVLTEQFVDTKTGDTFWSQNINASVGTAVKVTMTDTAPTNDQWNFVAVELVGEIS